MGSLAGYSSEIEMTSPVSVAMPFSATDCLSFAFAFARPLAYWQLPGSEARRPKLDEA